MVREKLRHLRDCMYEQVLPKSFLPDHLKHLEGGPFDHMEKYILQHRITKCKTDTDNAFVQARSCKHELERRVTYDHGRIIVNYCHEYMLKKESEERIRLWVKLQRLISDSKWSRAGRERLFNNLSDAELPDDTKKALGLGLSFSYTEKLDIVGLAKDISSFENRYDGRCDIIRGMIYGAIPNEETSSLPRRYVIALDELKRNPNLKVLRADKSKATVIINRKDYDEKMHTLLSDTNTYKKMNFHTFEPGRRNFVKQAKKILNMGHKEWMSSFSSINPTPGYMYALVKTHKPGNPFRVIISSRGTYQYRLSSYLTKVLSPLVNSISGTNIKNNIDLIEKLNMTELEFDFKMVSFDVKSLYPSVPLELLFEFMGTIDENKINVNLTMTQIIKLTKLCVTDNEFVHDGTWYSQIFGLGMGNCMSPVLANLFLEFFEINYVSKILPRNIPWYRYLDDIIALVPVDFDTVGFVDKLNGLLPSMKFTFEEENDNKLPFLDVEIVRQGRQFKFDVYRKPTNVNSYIHAFSGHTLDIKRAVFIQMYDRAHRVCSPEFLNNELNRIEMIGLDLGYDKLFLDRCFQKSRQKHQRSLMMLAGEEDNTDNNFHNVNKGLSPQPVMSLPFNPCFIQLKRKLMAFFNIRLIFRHKNLQRKIIKNASVTPSGAPGGVYKIECGTCPRIYIGQTADLNRRKAQHRTALDRLNLNNSLSLHKQQTGHCFNLDSMEYLYRNSDYFSRRVVEASLIHQSFEKNVNHRVGDMQIDPFLGQKISEKILQWENSPNIIWNFL